MRRLAKNGSCLGSNAQNFYNDDDLYLKTSSLNLSCCQRKKQQRKHIKLHAFLFRLWLTQCPSFIMTQNDSEVVKSNGKWILIPHDELKRKDQEKSTERNKNKGEKMKCMLRLPHIIILLTKKKKKI